MHSAACSYGVGGRELECLCEQNMNRLESHQMVQDEAECPLNEDTSVALCPPVGKLLRVEFKEQWEG